jgi:hypothetical protein
MSLLKKWVAWHKDTHGEGREQAARQAAMKHEAKAGKMFRRTGHDVRIADANRMVEQRLKAQRMEEGR